MKHTKRSTTFVSRWLRNQYHDELLQQLIETTPELSSKLPKQLIRQKHRHRQKQHHEEYLSGVYNGNFYRIKIPAASRNIASDMQSSSTMTDSSSVGADTLGRKKRLSWIPAKVPEIYTMNTRAPTFFKEKTQPPVSKNDSSTQSAESTLSKTSSNDLASESNCSVLPTTTMPPATTETPGEVSTTLVQTTQKQSNRTKDSKTNANDHDYFKYKEHFWKWLKENGATLILNFGSICSFIGITRSDVLELREFSVIGSVCALIFNASLRPFKITPVMWSFLFGFVNAYKIYEIVEERKGSVNLTAEQEDCYVNFFLPHSITPKQYTIIEDKAEKLYIPTGELIVRQNQPVNHIYLVVRGTTRASALGRYMTAISMSSPATSEHMQTKAGGPSSGAWIGETKFLLYLAQKEQKQQQQSANNVRRRSNTTSSNSITTAAMNVAGAEGLQYSDLSPDADAQYDGDTSKKSALDEKQQSMNHSNDTTNTESAEAHQTKGSKTLKKVANNNDQTFLSMYTIRAQQDCYVLRWSFQDMEELMGRSSDMKSALHRAITAAVVGKVINFTASPSDSECSKTGSEKHKSLWKNATSNLVPSWLAFKSNTHHHDNESYSNDSEENDVESKESTAASRSTGTATTSTTTSTTSRKAMTGDSNSSKTPPDTDHDKEDFVGIEKELPVLPIRKFK